jgi:trypsin
MRAMLACLCFVLLLVPSVFAAETGGGSQPLRAISQPIVNGLLTSALPSTAALLYLDPSTGELRTFCSGTLIGCRTVLTAAHCFCPGGVPCPPVFADKAVFLQHGGIFPIESVTVNPAFSFGTAGDVAVVRLTTPVTGVAPTPINTTGRPAIGSGALIAGFGRTQGSLPIAGIKRYGVITTASCSQVPNSTHICWNFELPLGPPGTDSSTCQGDSGGPLFTDFGTGAVLAGVTSGGNASCLPSNAPWDADVYVNRQWIQSVAGSDLNSVTCEPLPDAGSALAPIHFASGQLSAANTEDRYFFEVPSGAQVLGVTLNGENRTDSSLGDFDLYPQA